MRNHALVQKEAAVDIIRKTVAVDMSRQRFGVSFNHMVTLDGRLLDAFQSLLTGYYVEEGNVRFLLSGGAEGHQRLTTTVVARERPRAQAWAAPGIGSNYTTMATLYTTSTGGYTVGRAIPNLTFDKGCPDGGPREQPGHPETLRRQPRLLRRE